MGKYDALLRNAKLPLMYRLRQEFDARHVEDVQSETIAEIRASGCLESVRGSTVAVAVGSRGIANLGELVRSTVDVLKEAGATVFIIPAMGSQAGAVAENQAEMLAHLGITEESMGVAVRATMETVVLGHTPQGEPVYFDKFAAEADHTVSVVRVKPHTSFRGKYESGIVKMNVIGIGNQFGADTCHHLGMHVMGESLERFAPISLGKSNLLFSLAVVENAYDKIRLIRAVPKDRVMEVEPVLLQTAFEKMPKLPIEKLDVLVVDEMGKNIAGTGVDSNIVQRFSSPHMPARMVSKCLVVLDLTEETAGVASGMGLVNIATQRFFKKIDFFRTYPNAITSRTPMAVRMPIIMPNDRDAIRAGLVAAWEVDYDNPRVTWIKNTMRLDHMFISEALLPEAKLLSGVEVDATPIRFKFDRSGNLLDL